MRTSPLIVTAIAAAALLASAHPQSGLHGQVTASKPTQSIPNKSFSQISAAAPVPKVTPYGDDEDKSSQYVHGFRHGYTWSFGDTPYCPTNPNGRNHAVMHGWIDGWGAGVKEGGTNGLPAKYAPFTKWRDLKPDA